MNILALTQGRSLAMFHDVSVELARRSGGGSVGYYVADLQYFREFSKRHPHILNSPLVGEWEIMRASRSGRADLVRLQRFERESGGESLLAACTADRRITLGPRATLRQDYRSRFSYDRQLRLLDEGITAISGLFDRVKPDVVLSFICVTFGEYLGHLIAKSRGIPVLNLRPTRIENFVTLAPGVSEPSDLVRSVVAAPPSEDADWHAAVDLARDYLRRAQAGADKYEGVLPTSRKTPKNRPVFDDVWRRFSALARTQWECSFGALRDDQHVPSPAALFWYRRVVNPIRARRVESSLGKQWITESDLTGADYAFFPLHTEPEVTLLVHSPGYVNQIEVIRHVARSLPVGWTLVVKEHPASIGKRPLSWYRKLLQIPNVILADPAIAAKRLIADARLVVTIAGSVGFEAALAGRPVITLGNTPYELLPSNMVNRVRDWARLSATIRRLVDGYAWSEEAVVLYLAATLYCSARVNLYSTLLGRQGVHVPGESRTWNDEVRALVDLCERTRRIARRSTAQGPVVSVGQ